MLDIRHDAITTAVAGDGKGSGSFLKKRTKKLSPDAMHMVLYTSAIYRSARMDTAKVFWSGRSQAVRLPKDYRFDANEVRIRRQGQAVILEPIKNDYAWLDALIGPVDEDFAAAALEEMPMQERPDLDAFK